MLKIILAVGLLFLQIHAHSDEIVNFKAAAQVNVFSNSGDNWSGSQDTGLKNYSVTLTLGSMAPNLTGTQDIELTARGIKYRFQIYIQKIPSKGYNYYVEIFRYDGDKIVNVENPLNIYWMAGSQAPGLDTRGADFSIPASENLPAATLTPILSLNGQW